MPTTINGISSYATKTRGTAKSFIRAAVVNTVDVAGMDTDETAATSRKGTQTVNFGGSLVGGTDAGMGAGTFTASIVMNGTTYPISVTLSANDTVTTVVTAINADLPGTELALSSGDLLLTSPTAGNTSYVSITDTDIFSGMTGFVVVNDAVEGGMIGEMKNTTLGNGSTSWDAYRSAEEVYDTAADVTVITTDYTAADLNTTFDDVEVETELTAIGTKVNSLQNLVDKINKRS
jgi:hypothetical protein